MTNKELSLQFDLLYNNLPGGSAPGINEYEKSVLLTVAQDQLIKNYFNPLGNKYKEGHSDSEKRTIDFSTLTISSPPILGEVALNTMYRNTITYKRPENILIPRAFVLRNDIEELQVIPVTETEITRLFSKPYKEPYKGQAYKLEDSTSDNLYHIIVGKNHVSEDFKLYMRYVKKPAPIILVDLEEFERDMGLPENSLSIGGLRTVSECELDPSIHDEIIDRAINLAKVHYEGNTESIIQYSNFNE